MCRLGKSDAVDAYASKPSEKRFSSGPSQVSSRPGHLLRFSLSIKARSLTLIRLSNRSRSTSVTQSRPTTDVFQPQAAPSPYEACWYPVLDNCGWHWHDPDPFPPPSEPSREFRRKSYAFEEVHKITFEQSIRDRDCSENVRILEDKVFQLLDKHRLDLKDWPQLQDLLGNEGLKGKLTDGHLRWALGARCRVLVVKTRGADDGKFLKRWDSHSSWWVENTTPSRQSLLLYCERALATHNARWAFLRSIS